MSQHLFQILVSALDRPVINLNRHFDHLEVAREVFPAHPAIVIHDPMELGGRQDQLCMAE